MQVCALFTSLLTNIAVVDSYLIFTYLSKYIEFIIVSYIDKIMHLYLWDELSNLNQMLLA